MLSLTRRTSCFRDRLDDLVDCVSPRTSVRRSMFKLPGRNTGRAEKCSKVVLESKTLSSSRATSRRKLAVEDLFWESPVVHPHKMTGPTELPSVEERLDGGKSGTREDSQVGNSVTPR